MSEKRLEVTIAHIVTTLNLFEKGKCKGSASASEFYSLMWFIWTSTFFLSSIVLSQWHNTYSRCWSHLVQYCPKPGWANSRYIECSIVKMNIRPDTLFEFVAMKNNIALYQIFVWLVSNTYVVVLFIAPFYHICCICNKITTKFKYVWKFYVYGPYDGGKILNLRQNYIITNWKKCVSEMPWYDPLMIH